MVTLAWGSPLIPVRVGRAVTWPTPARRGYSRGRKGGEICSRGREKREDVVSGEAQVLMWWLAFGGTHVLGSSVAVRTRLIDRMGLRGFKGLYSLVALATFVPLCWVYFANRHAGAMLFQPASGMRDVTEWLMFLALVVLGQSLATPSPLTTEAEMSGHFTAGPSGIQRITRHPMNLAFAIFGAAHMLSNPFASDWAFFGSFVAYGLLSSMHQDRRTLASGREEVARFQEATSLIPFAAVASGKQRLAFDEIRATALVISIVVAGLLWYFHGFLFGGYGG